MIAVFKMCHARCVMKVSIPSLPTKHHVCFFGSPCTFSEEPVLSARSWKTNMAGFKVAKSARDQLTSWKYGPQRQRVESGPCHLPFEYFKAELVLRKILCFRGRNWFDSDNSWHFLRSRRWGVCAGSPPDQKRLNADSLQLYCLSMTI